MSTSRTGPGALIAGAGGVLLSVSLFLPWARVGGASRTGWEILTVADVYLAIVALIAILAAITGGRFGLFRPDVSVIGAADVLGVVATLLLAWLVFFDFPQGASREIGVWLALIGAATVAGGAGDYESARRGRWFPRIEGERGAA